jgi:DNA end-binding protein Ku
MARAIWRGTISFGMVNIPIKLFTATESREVSFRQLHKEDHSPIRLVKRCAADGTDLSPDEIVRGYEYAKDRYVIIEDEDLDKLPLPSKQTIELSAFVNAEEIDPLYYEKGYYIEPEDVGRKPFSLLVNVLSEKNLTAIGKLAIRTKERLCALRTKDGGLVLETLFYADEVRKPDAEPATVKVSAAEMKIAYALIDLLQAPFEPQQYQDEYREALLDVINAKLEGQEVAVAPAPAAAKPAVDLMAALKASVEAAKSRKGGAVAKEEPAEKDEAPAKPARRKKAASAR